jgi:hypothetical protein
VSSLPYESAGQCCPQVQLCMLFRICLRDIHAWVQLGYCSGQWQRQKLVHQVRRHHYTHCCWADACSSGLTRIARSDCSVVGGGDCIVSNAHLQSRFVVRPTLNRCACAGAAPAAGSDAQQSSKQAADVRHKPVKANSSGVVRGASHFHTCI